MVAGVGIECVLDLRRVGSQSEDGQEMMGDMVVKPALVEIHVKIIVILLKEL